MSHNGKRTFCVKGVICCLKKLKRNGEATWETISFCGYELIMYNGSWFCSFYFEVQEICSRSFQQVRPSGNFIDPFTDEDSSYVFKRAYANFKIFDRTSNRKFRIQNIHVSLPRGFHLTASHWTSWWGKFMRWILIQLLPKWTFVSPKPVQWPFYFGDKGLSRLKMDHPSAGSKSTESSWSFKHIRCTRNISSFTWNISEPKHKLHSWKNL